MKHSFYKFAPIIYTILLPVIAVIILLCFFTGINNLNNGMDSVSKLQLEQAVRKAAVSCYVAEGAYPPDLEYLQQHYGLQINSTRYTVMYDVFAENLMPDITVVENGQ